MFGLTFEKLLLVAIVAAVLIGPQRLPLYAGRLAQMVRALRSFVETARERAAEQTGLPLADGQWKAPDLSQYDPRRIVRDALAADPPSEAGTPGTVPDAHSADAVGAPSWTPEQIARIRPGQRFVTVGGSSHPTRLPISSLADGDPVRRAAETVEAPHGLDEPSETGGRAGPVRISPSMTG